MLGRRPEFNKAIISRRRVRGGRERAAAPQGGWIAGRGRKSEWAGTGRSEATHRRTGAAITWGRAVKVGMCRSRGARRLENIASDSLSLVMQSCGLSVVAAWPPTFKTRELQTSEEAPTGSSWEGWVKLGQTELEVVTICITVLATPSMGWVGSWLLPNTKRSEPYVPLVGSDFF